MPVGMPLVPGLSELSDKLLRYAERTFALAFAFVQKLTEVKDVYDVAKLQTDFIQAHVQAMSELVSDVSETATKAVMGDLKAPTSSAAQSTVTIKRFAGALAERYGMPKSDWKDYLTPR